MATRRWNRARPTDAFDPLSLVSLQKALREQLEQSGLEWFPPADFRGAGVYALYYIGDMPLYSPLRETECGVPIYVGRAEAGNSSYGEPASLESLSLVDRIKKHSRSVREAGPPLNVDDFRVRYLALDDAWIVLAERALLREYRPVVWNTVTPGFGANEPGTDRNNARSIWDTVHPGRARAGRLCNRNFTYDEMLERIGLAVTASVLDRGDPKDAAVRQVVEYRRRPIWRPRKKGEQGPDVVVQDQRRFREEMSRLGLEIPDHQVREGDTDSGRDPAESYALEGTEPEGR